MDGPELGTEEGTGRKDPEYVLHEPEPDLGVTNLRTFHLTT